jgi:DNA-directed RNA polymerase I, II, and III subunit RPABC1
MNFPNINTFPKIMQTLQEMLQDRHYTINYVINDHKITKKQSIIIRATKQQTKLIVFYYDSLKADIVRKIISILLKENIYKCIIVYCNIASAIQKTITHINQMNIGELIKTNHILATIQKEIVHMQKKNNIPFNTQFNIQLFNTNQLHYNVTKHEIVPKHIKMSQKNAKKILKKMNINWNDRFYKLPKIYKSDPVIKYYGWGVGSIIQIKRKISSDIEPHNYFRIVI